MDIAAFRDVPRRVSECFNDRIDLALDIHRATADLPHDANIWVTGSDVFSLEKVADSFDPLVYLDRLSFMGPWTYGRPDDPTAVAVKCASLNSVMSGIGSVYRVPAELMGKALGADGATPLTSALTTGAINAGLGYGAGKLYNKFLAKPLNKLAPNTFSGETVAPGVLAGLGAATGLGNVWYGTGAARAKQDSGQPLNWRDYAGLSNYGYGKSPLLQKTAEELSVVELHPDYLAKLAQIGDAGGLYASSIPVDAFNNVVWAPWVETNPFGTKSSYGTNEQPLRAPNFNPQAAAAMSGLAAAASAAKGGTTTISPADIARVAGYSAAGWTAGRLAAGLVGLTPGARDTLTRNGVIGGLVLGVTKSLGLL